MKFKTTPYHSDLLKDTDRLASFYNAIMEYDGKKGETIIPIANIDHDTRLVSGRSYMITKTDEGIVIT